MLVLDEPTNDLDLETLDLLEELLLEYAGTLLLVSHDREFLNNVVTSTLVLEGDGEVGEYVGGYDDWLRQAAAERRRGAGGRGPRHGGREAERGRRRPPAAKPRQADLQGGARAGGPARPDRRASRRSRSSCTDPRGPGLLPDRGGGGGAAHGEAGGAGAGLAGPTAAGRNWRPFGGEVPGYATISRSDRGSGGSLPVS